MKDLNIGAAVALHPVKQDVQGVQVPILYTAGSKDNLTQDFKIKEMYDEVEGQPKAYANLLDGDHKEPVKKTWNPYIIGFYDCHLKNDKQGCKVIY